VRAIDLLLDRRKVAVACQPLLELRDIQPDRTRDLDELLISECTAVLASLCVEQRVVVLPELP
jgi:hypothetical protein